VPIRPRQVVLLAAGMGTRLGELGGGLPKALFEVAGRKLLDRALEFAEHLGAGERVVVGGFRFDLVAAHLAGRPLRLLENRDYRIGNLRTLETALPAIDGAFHLMNIDHIYPPAVAQRILEQPGEDITAFCDFDRPLGDDDMKVKLDANRRVASIAKTLREWDCGYVGMTYVPAARLPRYRDAVFATRADKGDPANVEQVLQRLADDGEPVAIGDISGLGWYEVDNAEDLAKAEAGLAARRR
jgi:L-glutamine-phosphate cytidylyltransferase